MKFEAILFDCDGVLVDSERLYVEVEREHLARIGLAYELREYMERFQGLGSTDFWAALDADYQALGKGPLPETFGPDLDAATLARIEQDLEEIRGIKQLLEAHHGPRAVASSSRLHRLIHKLQHTGLYPYFEPHIYSGQQVENGKPAPDLFLFVAGQLGAAPERCLVIEDSANGVKAGRAAGMTVWGFVGGGHSHNGHAEQLTAAGAHKVVGSHDDLAGLLIV
ncbi:HAD family hydrolase [Roseibium denhamense]|uniref:Haloacid dehalogenase superfamily, subfamily IA, variant 3 with third motif having DD or ED n=1 Tax=Roseibium denhamense TaxID=76305 RepID=A0ABY1PA91_9HYPH|nr:HAD family hydrolase [Roseibium denhamense]MTI07380.1 HAD family hydrolase [Roseibium denhamense]SMP29219.1 haloacid dehalogenase superfamily, subfamily IA, variant 3 with third motif having DD or ED [Roseibium denhamense]